MISAGVEEPQDQITKEELSKVPDTLSGLIGESPSDQKITSKKIRAPIKMGISIFRDIFGKDRVTHRVVWDDVEKLLSSSCIHINKSACSLLKLSVFGAKRTTKGSLRSDENILEIFGIEGDYDDGQVTLAEAASRLKKQGVEACLYTTPSHTPEQPRWRVLVPLSKGYPPSDRARFVTVIDGMMGNILARESYTASQVYYFGKVKGAIYETQRVHGIPVDKLDPEIIEKYSAGYFEIKLKSDQQTSDLGRQCALHAVWTSP